MTPEQLDLVVARTGHDRYRWLTSDQFPDADKREAYRRIVARMADDPSPPLASRPTVAPAAAPPPPPAYPPLVDQLRGLARSLWAWARSGFALASSAERRRRRAVCLAPCPAYDPARGRCTACGCMAGLKPWLATADCPRGRWGPQEQSS